MRCKEKEKKEKEKQRERQKARNIWRNGKGKERQRKID